MVVVAVLVILIILDMLKVGIHHKTAATDKALSMHNHLGIKTREEVTLVRYLLINIMLHIHFLTKL